MKLCKDCVYNRWSIFGSEYYECHHPKNGTDPVTGKVDYGYGSINRKYSTSCGPSAVWFQPKKDKK